MDTAIDILLTWKAALLGVWLAAFFIAERLRPSARPPAATPGAAAGGVARLARNAGLWLVNTALSPLIVIPVSVLAAEHGLGWRQSPAFAWWSGPLGLALDLLVLDLLIYWWHRANHEFDFLWRFHEIHHLDRFLDTTSAVRFHFIEVLLSASARAVVIVLLDLPIASVVAFEVLVLVASIFHHSNLRLPRGLEAVLSRLIITPSIHWVHHHATAADLRSNYGNTLSLWDRLFGTRSPTPRTPDLRLGVPGQDEARLLELLGRPLGLGARAR